MSQAAVIAQLQTIFDTVFLEPVTLTPALSAKDVRFRVGRFADLILQHQREP